MIGGEGRVKGEADGGKGRVTLSQYHCHAQNGTFPYPEVMRFMQIA